MKNENADGFDLGNATYEEERPKDEHDESDEEEFEYDKIHGTEEGKCKPPNVRRRMPACVCGRVLKDMG